ncbi:iron-containing alcohol dehydrogenase [Salidesulfovibrio onnuriiensis]|uniref:iron-containing alcohol dehydrogenase n=1 Tax=Salidesulfovibrio onnuriiensis TaxID=2583823 RepID=UPI0011CCB124|nr:iron-containing alcohol dehydrogenase [Salidesulfovibrio onnuriiensis]
MWERNTDIHRICEIRVASRIYFGCGAIAKMRDIAGEMKQRGMNTVLCITGRNAYRATGAWDVVTAALGEQGLDIAHYDGATPNPTVDQVNEAAALGREAGAQVVLAIGGGSPIDTGKSAAILLANPGRSAQQLYRGEFAPTEALPLVAINLTHGTGTEANRFAVATDLETQHKPAIAYDCIYPWISIDDPALMTSLSRHQTLATSVDAVNHVIEAATTIAASPFSILTARETIRLVAEHLPAALEDPEDLQARYWLLYASMLAGTSFDNGLLHFTHALEHPLSAVRPELSHGIGLGVLLPSIIKVIYPDCAEVLADILAPIAGDLSGTPDEADAAALGVQSWLESIGLTERLGDIGFSQDQVPQLTRLAFDTPSLGTLLGCAPVPATESVVGEIYSSSF